MHSDSHNILKRLADGQEVLGLNGAELPADFRAALAEGATALRRIALVHDALSSCEVGQGPVAARDEQREITEPVGGADTERHAKESVIVQQVGPAPAAAAADEPATLAAQVIAPIPADDRPEPMNAQTDEPDAAGWRPSEDAMLLDEFVGLGLSLAEVAGNHGRAEADVADRLRTRHGIDVPVPDAPAKPAEPLAAMPAARAETPAAEPQQSAPEPIPEKEAVEPALDNYEAVIAIEMRRASPEAVLFATGVLKHMERAPSAVAQLQDYLQSAKARAKLADRLRLALLAKVVAKLRLA